VAARTQRVVCASGGVSDGEGSLHQRRHLTLPDVGLLLVVDRQRDGQARALDAFDRNAWRTRTSPVIGTFSLLQQALGGGGEGRGGCTDVRYRSRSGR
jgi:hypothetical protein